MALYLGTLTSKITGSIGGLTFSNTQATTTLRRRSRPTASPAVTPNAMTPAFVTASNHWRTLDATDYNPWTYLLGWLQTSLTVGAPGWMNPLALFTQARNNAQLSGLAIDYGFSTTPSPPDPVLTIAVKNISGSLQVNIGIGGHFSPPAYSLIYVRRQATLSGSTVPQGRWVYLGYVAGTSPTDVTAQALLVWGQIPPIGKTYALRVVALYAQSLVNAATTSFLATVEA